MMTIQKGCGANNKNGNNNTLFEPSFGQKRFFRITKRLRIYGTIFMTELNKLFDFKIKNIERFINKLKWVEWVGLKDSS